MFKRLLSVFILFYTQNIISQENIYPISLVDLPPIFGVCEQFNDFQQKKCFEDTIKSHIKDNIVFPLEAFEMGISGRVLVYFTIDSNGRIGEIQSRSPHEILKKEAERIISILPNVSPAIKDQNPVKISYSLPVDFFLLSRPSSTDIQVFAGSNVYSKADNRSEIVAVVKNNSKWSGSLSGDYYMIDYISSIGYVSIEDTSIEIDSKINKKSKNDIGNIYETNFKKIKNIEEFNKNDLIEEYVENITDESKDEKEESFNTKTLVSEINISGKLENNIQDQSNSINVSEKKPKENNEDFVTRVDLPVEFEETKNLDLKSDVDSQNKIKEELNEVKEMISEMKVIIQEKNEIKSIEENSKNVNVSKLSVDELAEDLISGNISQTDFLEKLKFLDEAKNNNELQSSINNLKSLDEFLNLNILTQSIQMKSELLKSITEINNKTKEPINDAYESEEIVCSDFTSFNYSDGRQNIVSANKFDIINNSNKISIYPILGSSKSSILFNIKVEGRNICFDSDSKILISFRDGSRTEISHESYDNCDGETVVFLGRIFGEKAFQDLNELKYKEVESIRIWMKNSLNEVTLSRVQSQQLMFTIDCLSSYMI